MTGIGIHNGGIGLAEIIVSAEHPVALFGRCRKGRAADVRGFDVHGNDALGDFPGDKGNQLTVGRGAALLQKVVKVVISGNVHFIGCAVIVLRVCLRELPNRRHGNDFVAPQSGHHQQQNQQQSQQYRAEYFQSFVCLLCHRISLIFA